eukprot:143816-Hanusia_phi.AAC.1
MEQEEAAWKHDKSRMEKQVAEEEQGEHRREQAAVGGGARCSCADVARREKLAQEEQKQELEEEEAKARAGYELVKNIIAGTDREYGDDGDEDDNEIDGEGEDRVIMISNARAGIETILKENQENERSLYNTLTVCR